MNYFEQLDGLLVVWINQLHSPFLDVFFWIVSSKLAWLPIYLLIFWAIFKTYGVQRSLAFLLCILLSVGLSDLISAKVIKEQVARSRPSHHTEWGPQLRFHTFEDGQAYKGGAYGFVSNHAANFAAICTWLFLIFRRRKGWIFKAFLLGTLLVGYSRMYLGVHYLSDVIGGYLLGCAMSLLIFLFVKKIRPQWVL